MREIESRLQLENPQFRRIWVQYSHNRVYRVVITLFPQDINQRYRMIFGEPNNLSFDSINAVLQHSKLEFV